MNENDWIIVACGYLGAIIHSLSKLKTLQDDARATNVDFKFADYIKYDWASIAITLLVPVVYFFIFTEAATKYEVLQWGPRIGAITAGLSGSWLIQLWLSRSKKLIRRLTDIKTGTEDNKPMQEEVMSLKPKN